ncbi:MAG TPA: hypothetical protein V6C99_05890, partial [Oculatellaceae cyanobacterium]
GKFKLKPESGAAPPSVYHKASSRRRNLASDPVEKHFVKKRQKNGFNSIHGKSRKFCVKGAYGDSSSIHVILANQCHKPVSSRRSSASKQQCPKKLGA